MVHPVQSVVESLYAAGRCPRLHVNATCEGVVCPDFIREQWRERLIIDLDSNYPLDLSFAEDGIGADLSFGGYMTRCSFPWEAIYVVADRATGRGIVLDQHMPESVRLSRQPPTTGSLPSEGDLSSTFDHDMSERRTGPSEREHHQSPSSGNTPTANTPTANAPTTNTQAVAAPDAKTEQEALRRRAAFRVIDGGS